MGPADGRQHSALIEAGQARRCKEAAAVPGQPARKAALNALLQHLDAEATCGRRASATRSGLDLLRRLSGEFQSAVRGLVSILFQGEGQQRAVDRGDGGSPTAFQRLTGVPPPPGHWTFIVGSNGVGPIRPSRRQVHACAMEGRNVRRRRGKWDVTDPADDIRERGTPPPINPDPQDLMRRPRDAHRGARAPLRHPERPGLRPDLPQSQALVSSRVVSGDDPHPVGVLESRTSGRRSADTCGQGENDQSEYGERLHLA